MVAEGGPFQHARRFYLGVDLVPLYVTVTQNGRYLTDVTADEFAVFENGRRQRVTFFQQSAPPLSLTLLLDMSSSMRHVLSRVQDAAIGFVRALDPGDAASVFQFGETMRIAQGLTDDRVSLVAAIRRANTDGSTALYDALYVALKGSTGQRTRVPTDEVRRRTFVVLSDGYDTASVVGFDEVLALAARSDVAIYTISLGVPAMPAGERASTAEYVLRRLASQTGARAFFPTGAGDLKGVYADIRDELASQYALAYESDDRARNGGFRQIEVHVNRAGAVARTRAGYHAPLH
jgi:Ca-activated chloride channel family protein